MADNTTIDPGSSPSVTVATDDVAGVHYQKVKLVDSTADSTTAIGTSSNPLPVGTYDASGNAIKAHRFGASSERIPWAGLMAYQEVDSDAVESGSTTTVINATAHWAVPGDVLAWIYWSANGGAVSYVSSVTADTITLDTALPNTPDVSDEFLILRGRPLQIDLNERLPVTVNNVVSTELPTAAALADAAANPTTPTLGAATLVYNGTTWDRARGDTTNGLDVDVTRVQGTVTVGDGGSSLTVDGTVAATQSGAWSVGLEAGTNNIGDVDVLSVPAPLSTTGGGTEATALRVTIANDSTGVISVDDNNSSLTVDGTVAATQSGTWTVGLSAGTNNIGDVDVLSVPAPLSTTGGGTEATALRVTIANDSTGVVSVDDNSGSLTVDDGGSSLTVDGTVAATQSGAWSVGLEAGTNNIGDVDVLSVPAPLSTSGGGTEATALRVTIATDSTGLVSVDDNNGSLTVDDGGTSLTVDGTVAATQSGAWTVGLSAGTNNIGDVDVLSVPAPLSITGSGTEASALRVTIATDSTGVVSVDDNNSSLTIDNAALNVGSNSALKVEGCTAHDITDAGNPLALGARAIAHGANPTAATAANRTRLYANRHGILWTIGGHPNLVSAEYYTTAAQTDDNILPAISTGTKYVITSISVTASAANTVNTSVRIGFGATTVPTQGTSGADAVSKVILSHPNIPPGSGVVKGNGAGVVGIGGDGEELRITCSAPTTGSLIVQVDYFTIES